MWWNQLKFETKFGKSTRKRYILQINQNLLQKQPVEFDYRECLHKMLEIAKTCFLNNLLWRIIERNNSKNTLIIALKVFTNQLISEVHVNLMYGHESQFKTK